MSRETKIKATYVVSIDPGDVHVGMAHWDASGQLLCTAEVSPHQVEGVLFKSDPVVIVVEAFHLYPNKAKTQTYSAMKTPRLIGLIEQVAATIGAVFYLQPANVREVAKRSPYGRELLEKEGKPKSNHALDALLHGIYFWHFGKGSMKATKGK